MKKRIILWFMQTRVYKFLLLNVVPFVRFSMYYTKIRGNKYHEGWNILQPGHIILTVDDKKLTGLLIPGFMSHAAFCINKRYPNDDYEIVEMTHTNYTQSDFFDICKESSRVMIVDCMDWDTDYKAKMIAAAKSMRSAQYDVEFTLGVQSLYCSELVLQADRAAMKETCAIMGVDSMFEQRLKVDLSDLAGIGRPYISPDGLLFAKNARCLWDSEGEFSGKLGPEIEALLENKV